MGRLYVGNFPYETTEDDLRELFAEFGQVGDIKIIYDRESGRSKGFGFVDVEKSEEAMKALDGTDYGERPLKVDIAREKQKSERRGPAGARRYQE